MNIRKPIDYSEMFAALDTLMSSEMSQMELYYAIGRLVSERPEKGAAVAAAEYLCAAYPDVSGFSPRNLRRMRNFYRTYGADPEILAEHGIGCAGKTARQLKNRDYDQFDLLIGMDRVNLRNMYRISGVNYDEKMHLLMEFTDHPDTEVADPWYTDDFEAAWQDILSRFRGLLEQLRTKHT